MGSFSPPNADQAEFIERGERAWQDYLRTGESIPATEVLARLAALVEAKRRAMAEQACRTDGTHQNVS